MDIALAIEKMAEFSQGNLHDINHFMKVWGFARTIGRAEGLDGRTQDTLELAAIIHDIACPLCRVKYGSAPGAKQELEGGPLARQFYAGMDVDPEMLERIVFLVSHHHTYTGVDGPDYQILLEADFLVNAYEAPYSVEAIRNFGRTVFRTATGLRLLRSIYLRGDRA